MTSKNDGRSLYMSPGMPSDEYQIVKILPHGMSTMLYVIKEGNDDQLKVLKIIDKKMESYVNINREVSILSKLNHPNIVKVYRYWETPETMNILMEYIVGTDLTDRPKGVNIIERTIVDMANALVYLKSKRVIHRDIKPENLLWDSVNRRVVLCDFGWAIDTDMSQQICGTPDFFSPEMVKKTGYGHQTDIWCLGLTVFELIHGYGPFQHMHGSALRQAIVMGVKFPTVMKCHKKIETLIKLMLQVNPDIRISAQGILQHMQAGSATDLTRKVPSHVTTTDRTEISTHLGSVIRHTENGN